MGSGDFSYTPNYCEENVWHLAGDPRIAAEARHVLFISNDARACPLWAQRSSPDPAQPVIWDYHVVLLAVQRGRDTVVYDLDSTRPFPDRFEAYARATFGASRMLPLRYRPRFRVLPAELFRARFDSDRSHMRTASGAWTSPPPPWPEIRSAAPWTLADALDFSRQDVGEVLDLDALERRFGPAIVTPR